MESSRPRLRATVGIRAGRGGSRADGPAGRIRATALDRSANGGVIIQAIVTLGRALGMAVVIEGVETEEQRVLLRLAGCNEMQGYLFAKPTTRDGIDQLVAGAAAQAARAPLRAGV